MNHPQASLSDPLPPCSKPLGSCATATTQFIKGRPVRLPISIHSRGSEGFLSPERELSDALVDYWGGNVDDQRSERLQALGGGVNVRISEKSNAKVVAEFDSWCGGYSGIAVLYRTVGPLEAGGMADREDKLP